LQQWDNMEPAGAGRYCESCEKHIIDLTTKSDAELIQFFKKKKDNVCGRLLASQLNRELLLPPTKVGWHWLLPLAIGAIAAPVQANELRPVMIQNDHTFALAPALVEPTAKISATINTINGRVVDDQTGEPLKGVKLRQKGFENVLAITDSTGKFELDITKENLETTFTFELINYSRVEARLNEGIVIRLAAERIIILGKISPMSLNQTPLYVVYVGKKSCVMDASQFSEISPDWINKLEILKDEKATSLYGAKAANGVIAIEIKKAYAKKINFSPKK
jgi:TonB-dependent SusC/RagA subfamily outer membrane receptor